VKLFRFPAGTDCALEISRNCGYKIITNLISREAVNGSARTQLGEDVLHLKQKNLGIEMKQKVDLNHLPSKNEGKKYS
jgi:hypothetical protein